MRSSGTARKRSARTRGRRGPATQILDAACVAFAEKGFHDATVSDICGQAGANIAAINYYFGDKETLYVEAWRLAFQRSLEAHPPDGGVPATAPAEERLRGRILSLVQRVADRGTHDFEIARKELANPTGLLAEVMRESIQPLQAGMDGLVRELLGRRASEQQVRFCRMSIIAQCMQPMMRERERKLMDGRSKRGLRLPELNAEEFADHVARFSLAGIRETRRLIEKGETGARRQPPDK